MGTLTIQVLLIALIGFGAGWFAGAAQGYANGVRDGRKSGWAAAFRSWRDQDRQARR